MAFNPGIFLEPLCAAHAPVSLTIVNIQHVSDNLLGIAGQRTAAAQGGSYEFKYNVHRDKHGALPLCFFGASVSETDRASVQAAVDAAACDDDDAMAHDDDDDAMPDDDDAEAGAGAGAGAGADGAHVLLAASVTDKGSRYGTVSCEVSLARAIAAYGACEFRVLGTTTYQLEHEHAIVVARPGDARVKHLPLLNGMPDGSPVQLRGDHGPCLRWTSQNLNGQGHGTHWVALSVAFLQPPATATVLQPSLRVPGAHVQLAFVERLTPNPSGKPHASLAEAESEFVVSLIKYICPAGGSLCPAILPQSASALVAGVVFGINPTAENGTWEHLVRLLKKDTGTSWRTADGVLQQHVRLNRFTHLKTEQCVPLLLGFLIANMSFV